MVHPTEGRHLATVAMYVNALLALVPEVATRHHKVHAQDLHDAPQEHGQGHKDKHHGHYAEPGHLGGHVPGMHGEFGQHYGSAHGYACLHHLEPGGLHHGLVVESEEGDVHQRENKGEH